jgi:hypothetical protein
MGTKSGGGLVIGVACLLSVEEDPSQPSKPPATSAEETSAGERIRRRNSIEPDNQVIREPVGKGGLLLSDQELKA